MDMKPTPPSFRSTDGSGKQKIEKAEAYFAKLLAGKVKGHKKAASNIDRARELTRKKFGVNPNGPYN
tara:strand:+ start:808 stop:1008 length:201 start_codon:yes stop_codon:yes gene_type:complete